MNGEPFRALCDAVKRAAGATAERRTCCRLTYKTSGLRVWSGRVRGAGPDSVTCCVGRRGSWFVGAGCCQNGCQVTLLLPGPRGDSLNRRPMFPGREPYFPQYGDEKDRQGILSAVRRLFPAMPPGEQAKLVDQIVAEIDSRSRRVASGGRKDPQPFPDAQAKVWRDTLRRLRRSYFVDETEIQALEQLVGQRYLGRPRKGAGG